MLLLTIDPAKVSAQLDENKPAYVVTASNIAVVAPEPRDQPLAIDGMTTIVPDELMTARNRLLLLRQRVIQDGRPRLSPEDLDRELDEARGRS